MNAIILVVDRLHAGYVGAYGNRWIETPSLDALAAQSMVFDQCLINRPRLESLYGSYWQGEHPLGVSGRRGHPSALASLLAAAGVTTTLLSDEPAVARHPLSGTFDSVVQLDVPEYAPVTHQIDQTHLAACFARIVDWLDSAREPFLLWCHLRGLGGPWDAPREFRTRYTEPLDPDPPHSSEVPCRMLEKDYDPDQLLGISQAYAGQVSLVDVCVGALLEFLEASPGGQRTLFTLASARGFPLGEHRRVGAYDESLYGELVHVPLWMRFPCLPIDGTSPCPTEWAGGTRSTCPSDGRLGEAARSQALVQPADLYPTLLDWWGIADPPQSPGARSLLPLVREEVESIRDRLCLVQGGHERAIRTPAWYLRDASDPELYVKPDDRWEVNDLADRCEEVVDLLREAFFQYERSLRSGELGDSPPLEEILVTGID